MEYLKSNREEILLPDLIYVNNREDIARIPIGVPYVYSPREHKSKLIQLLEYNVLWATLVKSKLFSEYNIKKLLTDKGYKCNDRLSKEYSVSTSGVFGETEDCDISEFMMQTAKADLDTLKALKILPVWMETIEEAVAVNIENFATYNYSLYNKKLDLVIGNVELKPQLLNLIIVDISGSIPEGISSSLLAFVYHLSETFYADILITGSKSTLYEYGNLHELDVDKIYKQNGKDNDQKYFLDIISKPKNYGTAIVFGDDDHPGYKWSNNFNRSSRDISITEGKKLNKFTAEKLISLHTRENSRLAGYALWFDTTDVTNVSDWVTYLN